MINISKCNQGINLKDSTLDIIARPVYINSSKNNGILATSSIININADAVTGATYGTALYSYNNPTAILAQNATVVESLRDSRFVESQYGVHVISNSTAKIQDNYFAGRAGVTSSVLSYSAVLSQTSFVQVFDTAVTGYGSLTGATGPATYRSNMLGVLIVDSTTASNLTSRGNNSSGTVVVDITKGSGDNRDYTAPPDIE